MTSVERTAHVLGRLGDQRPAALAWVKVIPSSWEDEEHRLIELLEECLHRCAWTLLSVAYDLHLESIAGPEEKSKASLETRCRALHRALDDLR